AQVALTPEAVALVFEEHELTYGELNRRSNQLSRYIEKETAIKRGESVSVLLDRSVSSVISMIAIMKLGCIYVPVDKLLPAARISYIIEESSSKILITSGTDDPVHYPNLIIIKPDEVSSNLDSSNLGYNIRGEESSFIIYTSGSTGNPKGVEQTHKTLYNLVLWDINGAGFNTKTRHLQYSSFSFDSSLHDIYYALSTGGAIYLANELLRKDLWELKNYIIEKGITTLSMPYSALKSMFSLITIEQFAGHQIQEIISTGEQLYVNGSLRAFLKSNPLIKIYNLYGPSETHVVTGCSYSFSEGTVPERTSIGKPIFNTIIYVLDKYMQFVPIGVEGEIFIGGWNLAHGYFGQPALTAEKFIQDPFRKGELLYRSGDIGKWLANGEIEYIMRNDNQVKINGYRIELNEIENAIISDPEIEEAIVLAKQLSGEEKELVAYLVCVDLLNTSDLRTYLSSRLPSYML
ncbi:amino acid adenylation domain-containing protein, partial [Pedobacter psychrotolerans]